MIEDDQKPSSAGRPLISRGTYTGAVDFHWSAAAMLVGFPYVGAFRRREKGHLKILAENVGPIRTASIDVKPLMLFIGTNNTGKSQLATAIYAALSKAPVYSQPMRVYSAARIQRQLDGLDLSEADAETLAENRPLSYADLPAVYAQFLTDSLHGALEAFSQVLVDELEHATGAPLKNLRRAKGNRTVRAKITVASEQPSWHIQITINARETKHEVGAPDLEAVWAQLESRLPRVLARRYSSRIPGLTLLTRDLLGELLSACFKEFPRHTYYLPAARSGLMHSHKVLASSIIRNSSLVGIQSVQIPAMSGVVAEFLSEIVSMTPRPVSEFSGIVKMLEKDILRGGISVSGKGSEYPEVFYSEPNGTFPLSRTSSMVSEMAPVLLYLRHVLTIGDLLIIEEPEAHLHPASQVVLARCLVGLVNRGLAVVMTTHSEFFLQQISNAVVASGVDVSGSDKLPDLPRSLTIPPDHVSVYLFSPGENGTVVKPLPIDRRAGIPEDTFAEVSEYLYDQTVRLDRTAAARGE